MANIYRIISIICFAGYSFYEGNIMHHINPHPDKNLADTIYGIWDSESKGVYIEDFSLQTIGVGASGVMISSSKGFDTKQGDLYLYLYPFHNDGFPDKVTGCKKDNSFIFTLTDDNEKAQLILTLAHKNNLVLRYISAGNSVVIHYRRHKLIARDQPPHPLHIE